MTSETNKEAVVLLSGGLDSATVLAMACEAGFRCHALSFDYGQRHRFELAAAKAVAAAFDVVEHRIVKIDLSAAGGFGHSALTDEIDVPKDGGTGILADRNTGGPRGRETGRPVFLSFGLPVFRTNSCILRRLTREASELNCRGDV